MKFPGFLALRLLLLAAGCLALTSCECYKQRQRWAQTEFPNELRFNRAGGGFIRSPYAPDAGLVDVRCFQPGQLVLCPFTGRTFEVPPYGGTVGIALRGYRRQVVVEPS